MRKLISLCVGLAFSVGVQAQPSTPSASPTGLYGVKLAESDLPKAIAFYEVLGMAKGRATHNGEVQEMLWVPPARGSNLSLFLDKNGDTGLVAGGVSMLVQVADTRAAVIALKAGGFSVSEAQASARTVVAHAVDPGGNKLEIVSPNRDAK